MACIICILQIILPIAFVLHCCCPFSVLDVLDDKNINSSSITSVFPSLQYACTNVAKERNKMDKGLYLSEK